MVVCTSLKALIRKDCTLGMYFSGVETDIELTCVLIMFYIFNYHSSCRTNDPNADSLIEYKGKMPTLYQDEFIACPVKKGSLVILDGLVIHASEPNRSDKSRLAFTFHAMETVGVKYDSDNWLQLPENMKFLDLYK